ncbi:TPA_asm: coat protein [ssRNA phage Gerhypos.3_9]|uniref:Coat protein n=2 Tax=Fiersviridae TaxID=2842319 RepID=A0A8S5L365_9VIRU|nr:coat protein [ssRNA phage Gerhypos.3_9]QDH87675.1 MAG: hypothetical protein H3Bulk41463_000002 [Leviviridae sp.]DAD51823.1 TPA_asm: coat protein [ssRNA phage Gerhypos.3_9]
MAQRGNITLTDAATTPVNHVFKPIGLSDQGVLTWRDSNQTIYSGQAVLTLSQRLADRKSKTTKVEWKLETPVLEVTSPSTSSGIQPAPTVAYRPLVKMDFILPDRMTLQERKDLLSQIRDLLSESILTTQVQDLDMIY